MDEQNRWSEEATYSRRRTMLLGASAALVSVSGCLGVSGETDTDVPAAVALPKDATCDVCGMVIAQHPGPTSEIFYADNSPDAHENPARFDSTWEAYQYDFEREKKGWKRTAFYVMDYSSVDYTVTEDDGAKLISTHPRKDGFALVDDVTYVVGSEVLGAMGKDLIAFTAKADAKSFQSKHGGDLATHDEVTQEVIAGLGR
ncbi:nitrous oxide reductase accessory protein NosL [Haladaptatus sp. NG-WS-4]